MIELRFEAWVVSSPDRASLLPLLAGASRQHGATVILRFPSPSPRSLSVTNTRALVRFAGIGRAVAGRTAPKFSLKHSFTRRLRIAEPSRGEASIRRMYPLGHSPFEKSCPTSDYRYFHGVFRSDRGHSAGQLVTQCAVCGNLMDLYIIYI